MLKLIDSLTRIGNLPGDSTEAQLHKRFLITMAVLMSMGGLMWGTISFSYGLYWQGSIPYGYTLITILNLTYFYLRKHFATVRFIQVLISLLLPYFFQWSLGGFAVTGAMMLWSLLALLGSLTFQSIRQATGWLVSYVVLAILSGYMDPFVRSIAIQAPPNVVTIFFVTNIVVISSIVVGLMLYFVASRDSANQELLKLTNQLEDLVETRTRELKETLAHLTAIIDNMADGLLVSDEDGRILRMNPALVRIYELDSKETLRGAVSEKLDANVAILLRQTMRNHEIMTNEVELPGNRIGLATAACILTTDDAQSDELECLGTVTVIRDITREKEVDRMKTDFISNVSHELRTPLTSVLGFARIIQKKFSDVIEPQLNLQEKKVARAAKQVSENTAIIVSEGERLTNLINTVLDISKMEAGKTEWNMQALPIQSVIERSVSATSALFNNKLVELRIDIQAGIPAVIGDHDRLMQVLINLISNAVKFTDEGSITIQALLTGESQVQVNVIDTGLGISKTDQARVFDKFQQVGDTLTDKPQGTGLGLPICKQIVEHHGGQIWVTGEAGLGSTFSFVLPIQDRHIENKNIQSINLDSLIQNLNQRLELDAQTSDGISKTILITDDDPGIRQLLCQELSDKNYKVLEAENGIEAIQILKKESVDLIILDIMMPRMNGYDVAAIIKNDPNTMDIPILMHSVIEDQERGLKIGVDKYITKSGDMQGVIKEVEVLISKGPSQKQLLVMDENEATVKTLVDVLKARGYHVSGALDPKQALESIRSNQPDMVIVDALFSQKHDLIQTFRFENGMENLYFLLLGNDSAEN
ncbi:MAG: response regulator [Leptospiraceae bacterium]|nr:response regulator [Leptospiraceae bacterium]